MDSQSQSQGLQPHTQPQGLQPQPQAPQPQPLAAQLQPQGPQPQPQAPNPPKSWEKDPLLDMGPVSGAFALLYHVNKKSLFSRDSFAEDPFCFETGKQLFSNSKSKVASWAQRIIHWHGQRGSGTSVFGVRLPVLGSADIQRIRDVFPYIPIDSMPFNVVGEDRYQYQMPPALAGVHPQHTPAMAQNETISLGDGFGGQPRIQGFPPVPSGSFPQHAPAVAQNNAISLISGFGPQAGAKGFAPAPAALYPGSTPVMAQSNNFLQVNAFQDALGFQNANTVSQNDDFSRFEDFGEQQDTKGFASIQSAPLIARSNTFPQGNTFQVARGSILAPSGPSAQIVPSFSESNVVQWSQDAQRSSPAPAFAGLPQDGPAVPQGVLDGQFQHQNNADSHTVNYEESESSIDPQLLEIVFAGPAELGNATPQSLANLPIQKEPEPRGQDFGSVDPPAAEMSSALNANFGSSSSADTDIDQLGLDIDWESFMAEIDVSGQ